MFVVYAHPSDFPDSFVVRRWTLQGAGLRRRYVPAEVVGTAPTLEAVRLHIPLSLGLVRFPREPADAPCIVETWL